jgi:hypothetical protein
MLLPLIAVLAAAPTPGTYVFEGGAGTLTLEKGTFSIEVVGANAHVCALKGTWTASTGFVDEEGSRCDVTFAASGPELKVSAKGDACRDYCGARATFEGTYLRPKKACTRPEVKRTRDRFKAQFDRKDDATAIATLEPVLRDCSRVTDRFTTMWIRNDLALTYHRAGNDPACLAVLEPLAEYRDAPPDEPVGYEPAFADEFARIAKATRTNAKLCGFVPKK